MSTFWLSRDEVRELDRRAINDFGVPGIVLMENAGRGCAELLMKLNPEQKPVVILCGPGNNGGDGFVIARHLDNNGWKVRLHAVISPAQTVQTAGSQRITPGFLFAGLPPDAYTNYMIVSRCGPMPFSLSWRPLAASENRFLQNDFSDELIKRDCWIIDALFGTGLSRALGSPFDELVSIVNASPNPVLAVDIPSGLDCDRGEPLGPTIRATHTATFVAHKRGFLNPESRKWTGEIHVVDIGAPRVLVDEYRQRPR
jgi:NAD(P)H-hydrate epimerase